MNPRIPRIAVDATLASALALAAPLACAQPQFGNPSPTAGSKTSQQANAAADTAMYQPVEYANNFRLVLEVADVETPRLEFPVSERAAHEWCARLNAIFAG